MFVTPLLVALLVSAAAAAQPSYETVWKDARAARMRGHAAQALEMVDAALARAGDSDAEAVWALRVMRAGLLVQTDRAAARKQLARPLPPPLRTTEVGVRHLLTVAMVDWFSGDRERAAVRIEEASELASRLPASIRAEVLQLRGSITNRLSDVEEALRLARMGGDPMLVAAIEAALVYTWTSRGQLAEAVALGEPLRQTLARLEMRSTLARHLGNLGWTYAELGDYEQAFELAAAAEAEAARIGDDETRLVWLTNLGDLHRFRYQWADAARFYEQVLALIGNDDHLSKPDAYAGLAHIHLEEGRLADARAAVRLAVDETSARIIDARIDVAEGNRARAVKKLQAVLAAEKDATTRIDAQTQLGRIHALDGKDALARRAFDEGVRIVREERGEITNSELRISYFNTASELFDEYVDFLVNTNRIDDALRVTETSRAQTLAEGRAAGPAARVDPRVIAKERNATILCYWLGRRNAYVWTVTPSAVTLTRLARPEADIEKSVEQYRARLLTTAGVLERSAPTGRALFHLLIPHHTMPRGEPVVIVPDGRLHTLNFETLVVPGGRPRYWIEDVVISNASSLQLLARADAPAAREPAMLLVGNPAQVEAAFPPLRYAADEIARIEKQFPRRAVLSGRYATPAAYAAAKPQAFDFVHFVAHGVASRTRPLDSAVILAPDATRNYRLAARDVAESRLAARLVTISSCHGAGEATYAGEGLVGLAWAFLRAGAEQVVAALWAVNDPAAPQLMDQMYAGIRAGREPAAALREAKLSLIRSKSPRQHPRYWAPFVIYQ